MQDLLPSQKTNSLYSAAGSNISAAGGSVSGVAGGGGSSNYSTIASNNRNTLNTSKANAETTATTTVTLPNGNSGLTSNSTNANTLPTSKGNSAAGGGNGGNAGAAVTLTKPHHYNFTELSDFANVDNEEQANCQIQEFPRHSLVIVEKLGSGVFGEYHLCETKGLSDDLPED
uniref:Uncharacterized protein n=1 Tax=Glossina palpalis gambiensis TaxID=67801 RepID=A0A1B0BLF6_9MUSC